MMVPGTTYVLHGGTQLARGKLTKMAPCNPVGLDSREVTSLKPTESLSLDKNKIPSEEASTHRKATLENSQI